MKKQQAIFAIILALAIGYAGGFYTHLLRYAKWHRQAEAVAAGRDLKLPAAFQPLQAEFEKARKLHAAGQAAEARKILAEGLRVYPQAKVAQAARELLGTINTELFFASASQFGKTEYVVQRGDTLSRIAQKLSSSPEMIIQANDLSSTMIHPGNKLVVPDGDFTLTIDLPGERVVVHHSEGFFKQYPIQSIQLPPSSQPRITTKVTATTLWKEGDRVSPTAPGSADATPWIHLARPGYILYGVSENGEVESSPVEIKEEPEMPAATPIRIATPLPLGVPFLPGKERFLPAPVRPAATPPPDVPPLGIALLMDDLSELRSFIRRGTPVTILRQKK